MKRYSTIAVALLGFTALSMPGHAQSTTGVDPACIMKNADGTETVDKTKCPDGVKPSAGATGTDSTAPPAPGGDTTQSTTQAPAEGTTTNSTTNNTTTTPDANSSAKTTDMATGNDLIVPADAFNNAKVMTASDFIGKRVYSTGGEDIGEVNDLIVTDNGAVQAVILGVGGFLGIGEKDVAVSMRAIEMQQDGNSTKLIVAASKDQLNGAPSYDRTKRTYTN